MATKTERTRMTEEEWQEIETYFRNCLSKETQKMDFKDHRPKEKKPKDKIPAQPKDPKEPESPEEDNGPNVEERSEEPTESKPKAEEPEVPEEEERYEEEEKSENVPQEKEIQEKKLTEEILIAKGRAEPGRVTEEEEEKMEGLETHDIIKATEDDNHVWKNNIEHIRYFLADLGEVRKTGPNNNIQTSGQKQNRKFSFKTVYPKKHRTPYLPATTSKTTSLRRCQMIKYLHSPRSLRNLEYLRKKIGQTRWRSPKSLKSPSPNPRSLRYL